MVGPPSPRLRWAGAVLDATPHRRRRIAHHSRLGTVLHVRLGRRTRGAGRASTSITSSRKALARGEPFGTTDVPWGYAYYAAFFYRLFGDHVWVPVLAQVDHQRAGAGAALSPGAAAGRRTHRDARGVDPRHLFLQHRLRVDAGVGRGLHGAVPVLARRFAREACASGSMLDIGDRAASCRAWCRSSGRT